MGTDGLRFRQVVVVDEHEDDDEPLSSRATMRSPMMASASDLPAPLPHLGGSRASARGPHLTPSPPHTPFDSSPNHHESAVSVNDGNLEHRAPGPSTGPSPSRGSPDQVGLVTGALLSPYDATIEERQRIFGHNVLPPRAGGSDPYEIHLVPKEITLAIVSTCRPSIHSDLST
jgi:hypothetical protein